MIKINYMNNFLQHQFVAWFLLGTLLVLPTLVGSDNPVPIVQGDGGNNNNNNNNNNNENVPAMEAGAAAAAVEDSMVAAGAAGAAKDVFDLLDANHDGRMDRLEFQQAIDQFEDFLRHHPSSDNGEVQRTRWWAKPKVNLRHRDLSFWNGFTSAVAMILATEIGDKTFFIAAVLSMKQDRRCVFGGAILALIIMTILSTLMGLLLPQFLDRKYTHLLAGVLFGYFGIRLLYESRSMASHKVSEELEEVEEEILHTKNKKGGENSASMDDSSVTSGADDDNNNTDDFMSKVDPENPMRNRGGGGGTTSSGSANNGYTPPPKSSVKKHRKKSRHHSNRSPWHLLLLQSFTLTFVAEWGDRSQIATIALAAAKNPYGVTIGGCIGHSMCTGLAVLGGRMLAARISEKTVSQWGGALFLLFGIHSLFFES